MGPRTARAGWGRRIRTPATRARTWRPTPRRSPTGWLTRARQRPTAYLTLCAGESARSDRQLPDGPALSQRRPQGPAGAEPRDARRGDSDAAARPRVGALAGGALGY